MHVKIEACVRDRPVREDARGTNILFRDRFKPFEMSGLTDTDQRSGFQQIAALVSGYKFVQEIEDWLKLIAADKHRTGQICGVCAVNARAVRHVASDNAGKRRPVEQNVPSRERQV